MIEGPRKSRVLSEYLEIEITKVRIYMIMSTILIIKMKDFIVKVGQKVNLSI